MNKSTNKSFINKHIIITQTTKQTTNLINAYINKLQIIKQTNK